MLFRSVVRSAVKRVGVQAAIDAVVAGVAEDNVLLIGISVTSEEIVTGRTVHSVRMIITWSAWPQSPKSNRTAKIRTAAETFTHEPIS